MGAITLKSVGNSGIWGKLFNQFFFGNYENKIDAKGRVSIPAPYRDLLAKDAGIEFGSDSKKVAIPFHLRPSTTANALEICLQEYFTLWDTRIRELDPMDPRAQHVAANAYGGIVELSIDGDGRIILPKKERTLIQCADKVMFLGIGRTFLIMEPENGQQYREEARQAAAGLVSGTSGGAAS